MAYCSRSSVLRGCRKPPRPRLRFRYGSKPRQRSSQIALRTPVGGWGFGASGIPKGFWVGLSVVLVALSIFLLGEAYTGYGVMVLILALAAAVNLLP